MKKFIIALCALFSFLPNSYAQEIKFDNVLYKLKFSAVSPSVKGYGNEYFKPNENFSNWSEMIGIYHYPNENNPLKYAENFDKHIEQNDNCLLLKLVENKDANKAVLSFLTNNCENSRKYFEYDVYKFEKSLKKGMIVSKYASKHYFNDNNEITQIAQKIKKDNDKYLELFIISQTPTVLEQDITDN